MSDPVEIYTSKIFRLSPKIVTLGVEPDSNKPYDLTTVNLPITNDVYVMLLKNLGKGNFVVNYPLVFLVNDEGISFRVLPYRIWNEEKAKAKTSDTNNTPCIQQVQPYANQEAQTNH
jgi:hypothetical protein